jgi:hypothetical protein
MADQSSPLPRLDELIKGYCTGTLGRPGEVFVEIGPNAWTSVKTRTPKPQQISGGSVQIHDLTGIRVLINPDFGDRWELRDSFTGDVCCMKGSRPMAEIRPEHHHAYCPLRTLTVPKWSKCCCGEHGWDPAGAASIPRPMRQRRGSATPPEAALLLPNALEEVE